MKKEECKKCKCINCSYHSEGNMCLAIGVNDSGNCDNAICPVCKCDDFDWHIFLD